MKILFVTLEQSARENLKVLLNEKFFQNNIDKFYTFGMSQESLPFKDLTNINNLENNTNVKNLISK